MTMAEEKKFILCFKGEMVPYYKNNTWTEKEIIERITEYVMRPQGVKVEDYSVIAYDPKPVKIETVPKLVIGE